MRKLLLIFTFLFSVLGHGQSNSLYYVFIDLTDPELIDPYKKKIKQSIPDMIANSNVRSGNGLEIRFFAINNLKQGARSSMIINPREISWFENKFIREDEINAFKKKVNKALSVFVEGEYPHTRIIDAIQSEMPKFKRTKAREKFVIVFSDLFENYSDNDDETIEIENIFFVRGISKPLDQQYIRLGDEHEVYWRQRIPGVIISTDLEL